MRGIRGRRIGRRAMFVLGIAMTVGVSAGAEATGFEFRADHLGIFRSGDPYFTDAFEDGNPQVAPGGFLPGFENPAGADGSYFVAGTPTENGGRLILNSIGAATPGLFVPVSFELAVLDTPTIDPATGLNLDTAFAIFSRWDLLLPPAGSFSGFEMGLTDGMGPVPGDDRVNLGVLRFPDDTLEVAFRAQDPADPANFLTLGVQPLTLADFIVGRQIDLALVKATAGDSPITAFWRFVDGAPLPGPGDLPHFNALTGSREIYNGELFTRIQLNGFEDRTAVALPPSLLLVALAAAAAVAGHRLVAARRHGA